MERIANIVYWLCVLGAVTNILFIAVEFASPSGNERMAMPRLLAAAVILFAFGTLVRWVFITRRR